MSKNREMPKEDENDKYSMDAVYMGKFIIFETINYEENFKGKPWAEKRVGSTGLQLKKTMENLGFQVVIRSDQTKEQIVNCLKYWTRMKEPYNSYTKAYKKDNYFAAFGIGILTHGDSHGWLATYNNNEWINIAEIHHYLHEDNFIMMLGKPKLVIVQACRGHAKMTTSRENDYYKLPDMDPTYAVRNDNDYAPGFQKWYPNEADILTYYAVTEGYTSYRDWMTTALEGSCSKYGLKENFLVVLTQANRTMCGWEFRALIDGKWTRRKQTAEISSTLRKDLFFRKENILMEGKIVEVKEDSSEFIFTYNCAKDMYSLNGYSVSCWATFANHGGKLFRKEENDWKMCYLAMKEGSKGYVWVDFKFQLPSKQVSRISVTANSATFKNGEVTWTLFSPLSLTRFQHSYEGKWFAEDFECVPFSTVSIAAMLFAPNYWQHAQLFRQALNDDSFMFEVRFEFKK